MRAQQTWFLIGPVRLQQDFFINNRCFYKQWDQTRLKWIGRVLRMESGWLDDNINGLLVTTSQTAQRTGDDQTMTRVNYVDWTMTLEEQRSRDPETWQEDNELAWRKQSED